MSRRRRYPRVCAHPDCPTSIGHADTYCPTHQPAPWAGSTRRQTLPRNWQAIRRQALTRDGYRCTHPGCTHPATDVDHITAHAAGGTDHLDNLTSLCHHHHQAKTIADAAAGRRRARRG